MKPEEIRKAMGDIQAKLDAIVEGEGGYTPEQLTDIAALNEEWDGLDAQLKAAEAKIKIAARANESKRQTQAASPATQTRVEVGKTLNERFGGFESSGHWLMAVKKAGQTGEIDKRLLQNATAFEKIGEDGGFLVPEEISEAIVKKMDGDDSLMARANVMQVSGNTLSLNVDETQPWNGGVQAYWTAEGATMTESKPQFKQPSWRLQKLAALVKATDELLDDATALESYIKNQAPPAMVYQVNKAILTGNGVGKPTGIINSGFAVTVSKESMQSADTVLARNVIKMHARMFPASRARGIWVINPAVEEQLHLMVDDNDEFIYLAPGSQLNQTPYATLLGKPVLPMMGGTPALGDVGDISFLDLSYYWMIRKAMGIKSSTSIHLHFDKDITTFKFTMRVDGKCPFQAPVTTEFGSYQMSAFVLLEAR